MDDARNNELALEALEARNTELLAALERAESERSTYRDHAEHMGRALALLLATAQHTDNGTMLRDFRDTPGFPNFCNSSDREIWGRALAEWTARFALSAHAPYAVYQAASAMTAQMRRWIDGRDLAGTDAGNEISSRLDDFKAYVTTQP